MVKDSLFFSPDITTLDHNKSIVIPHQGPTMKHSLSPLLLSTSLGFATATYTHAEETMSKLTHAETPHDLSILFAIEAGQLVERMKLYCTETKQALDELIAIPHNERTFANTVERFDRIAYFSNFSAFRNIVAILSMVHPDSAMRSAAQEADLFFGAFYIDNIGLNVALYQVCKAYHDGNARTENLSPEQHYYLESLLTSWEKSGLGLPEEQRLHIAQLSKDIEALGSEYDRNVRDDQRTISVSYEKLHGLPDDIIKTLPQSDDGLYLMGTDYPTYTAVMEYCTVESTRKALYRLFTNRAYPINDAILKTIKHKRHELAQALGFPTFAHVSLNDCMAKHPDIVEKFLMDLLHKAHAKEVLECSQLKQSLPESVQLLPDGTIKPWDIRYIQAHHKRNTLALDEHIIAEYFSQDVVMKGLFDIYGTFFNIDFKEIPIKGLWHDEVKLVGVYSQDSTQLLGHILLDLYPRPNKFGHACNASIIPSITLGNGTQPPAATLVIANFARPTETKPALWHRTQAVRTLFHEFGHALHDILGRTCHAGTAGTSVKWDFVELPSQMLECWLCEEDILKKISRHYKTGEPLPHETIANIKLLEQLSSGYDIKRQISLALLSLTFHQNKHETLHEIMDMVHALAPLNVAHDPESNTHAAFGHLIGYNARYYGYLWSQVFAQDLFADIKKQGILNPEIGARYVREIIGKGGSKDPNELLTAFLGREPNQEAFLTYLGFE